MFYYLVFFFFFTKWNSINVKIPKTVFNLESIVTAHCLSYLPLALLKLILKQNSLQRFLLHKIITRITTWLLIAW